MYKDILVLLDNSDYSLWSLDRAVELAREFKATLVGSHAYAAKLHETRFTQMEPGLPAKYQVEEELQRQRQIHGTLIEKGLAIISDSYLDVFQNRCRENSIPFKRKMVEGKNYAVIVDDVNSNSYDLVAYGILGQGVVSSSRVGSVAERVARRVKTDMLVAKNAVPLRGGRVAVGVDGSPESYAAMQTAITFAKKLGCKITALAVFDPDFHYKVFNNVAQVLSEEAGNIFRFKEQEKLHEEIIDSGLEKIYRDNLDVAVKMAEDAGLVKGRDFDSEVLAGKAYDEMLKWLDGKNVALFMMGKTGVHADAGLDFGSNAEFIFRYAPCSVYLTSRKFKPEPAKQEQEEIEWTVEAREMLERVPGFVRNMVRGHMESNARKAGKRIVTLEMMLEARKKMGM
ncbi:MAG: universal stress protein [Nitrospinae bacterium]|nr:universal stress protein [Nitrospinota bacterium]